MELVVSIIVLFVGLVILLKSSSIFVNSAERVAKIFGISEFVIGLTLVAIGTSLPELMTSIIAVTTGNPGIVTGNVMGSNIANIGLILGISGFIAVLKIEPDIFRKDSVLLLGASLILYFFAWDRVISFVEGIILLVLFSIYLWVIFGIRPSMGRIYRFRSYVRERVRFGDLFKIRTYGVAIRKGIDPETHRRLTRITIRIVIVPFRIIRFAMDYRTYLKIARFFGGKVEGKIRKEIILIAVSSVGIFIGAKYLVQGAVDMASHLGVPDSFIAITLIALGTSLPELSVSIISARKGLGNMILGNIIGSNIANIGLIIGVSALIAPIPISILELTAIIPFMLLMTILCVIFIRSGWIIRMFEAFSFIILYLGFIIWLILRFSSAAAL